MHSRPLPSQTSAEEAIVSSPLALQGVLGLSGR
jgi:hypothetical protein